MTRITTDLKNALAAGVVRPIYFTEIETAGDPLYLCSVDHNVAWDAKTWLGNSLVQSEIAGLEENQGRDVPQLEVQFNAYDSALLSILFALTQKMTCTVHIGALNSSGAVIADPELIFEGKFVTVEMTDDGETLTAAAQYENEMADFRRINEIRWTYESQAARFPGDNGFIYCATLADKKIFWGTAPQVQRIRKRRVGGRN